MVFIFSGNQMCFGGVLVHRAPWIPTPRNVIEYLINSVVLDVRDVVLDVGCGDGRVLFSFAGRGIQGVCIEVDRVLCNIVEIASNLFGLQDRVKVVCRDVYTVDFQELSPQPTVVYLYLYKSILEALGEKFERELLDGVLIITLDFPIPGWSPFFVKHVVDENNSDRFLWFYMMGVSNPSARRFSFGREKSYIGDLVKRRRLYLY